jgi:hypothetical protein
MNKSYWSNLRLNSLLNGKNTNPPLMTLCVVVTHVKKLMINPFLCVKINQVIYIYTYTVTIKKSIS